MSVLFGGNSQSHDIATIVEELQGGASAICNESVAGTKVSGVEIEAMAESIRDLAYQHYSSVIPERMDEMLKEDAEQAAQIFRNNLEETQQTLTESAALPSLVTLTA